MDWLKKQIRFRLISDESWPRVLRSSDLKHDTNSSRHGMPIDGSPLEVLWLLDRVERHFDKMYRTWCGSILLCLATLYLSCLVLGKFTAAEGNLLLSIVSPIFASLISRIVIQSTSHFFCHGLNMSKLQLVHFHGELVMNLAEDYTALPCCTMLCTMLLVHLPCYIACYISCYTFISHLRFLCKRAKGPMIPIPKPAGFCLQGAWLGSYHSDCYLDVWCRDLCFCSP